MAIHASVIEVFKLKISLLTNYILKKQNLHCKENLLAEYKSIGAARHPAKFTRECRNLLTY